MKLINKKFIKIHITHFSIKEDNFNSYFYIKSTFINKFVNISIICDYSVKKMKEQQKCIKLFKTYIRMFGKNPCSSNFVII